MAMADFSLAGKVAIVTGGSRGIGRSIAIALAEHGADVAIAARKPEALAEAVAAVSATGRRAIAVPTNVRRIDELRALVDQTRRAARARRHPRQQRRHESRLRTGPGDRRARVRLDHGHEREVGPLPVELRARGDARARRGRRDRQRELGRRLAGERRDRRLFGVEGRADHADAGAGEDLGQRRDPRQLHRARAREDRVRARALGRPEVPQGVRGRRRRCTGSPRPTRWRARWSTSRAPASSFVTGQTLVLDGGRLL